jgi:hypothetical protein
MKKRVIIGAGQCGMKLAYDYFFNFKSNKDEMYALSTSSEDSVGIPKSSVLQIAKEGSGKKFSRGLKIWEENYTRLEKALNDVYDSDVIYFASTGGGSGSSSIKTVSEILLNQNNRIFLVLVMPFGYETLPFKPNTLRSVSILYDNNLVDKMSILLFDNNRLSKMFSEFETQSPGKTITVSNLEKMNRYIIERTSLILDMNSKYHREDKFTPFTIDEIEHESVVFSKGFIGVCTTKVDEKLSIKFDYGKLKEAKNIIIAKVSKLGDSDYTLQQNSGNFLSNVKSISRRAKNARVMYGIIRSDEIDDGTYIIIANNLDVIPQLEKMKTKVESNVQEFRKKEARGKTLSGSEKRMFDI